jgi:hypothetical protein
LLVTFAPDTKFTTVPTNASKPSKSGDGSLFSWDWKFPFGTDLKDDTSAAKAPAPEEPTSTKDAASAAKAPAPEEPKSTKDAASAAKAPAPEEPTSNKDAASATKAPVPKAPFVFILPTIDETKNKTDEEVIKQIDDLTRDFKSHVDDGGNLLRAVSPRNNKPPISPRTGNARRPNKGGFSAEEITDAKRKERDSSQKQKKEKVVDRKRWVL